MSESGNSSPVLIDARDLACPGPIIRLKALLDRINCDPSFSLQISGSGPVQEGVAVPDSPNPPASFSPGTRAPFPAPDASSGSVRIEVLAGNESAVANLQRFARHSGCTDIEVHVEEGSASVRNPDEPSPRFWRVGMFFPFSRSGDDPSPSGISPESWKSAGPEAGSRTSAFQYPGSPGSPGAIHAETIFIASRFLGTGSVELGSLLMRGFIYTLTQLKPLPARLILMNSGVELACSGSDSLTSLDLLASRGVEIFVCGTCLEYYSLRPSLKVGKVSNMYEIAGFLAQTPVLRV